MEFLIDQSVEGIGSSVSSTAGTNQDFFIASSTPSSIDRDCDNSSLLNFLVIFMNFWKGFAPSGHFLKRCNFLLVPIEGFWGTNLRALISLAHSLNYPYKLIHNFEPTSIIPTYFPHITQIFSILLPNLDSHLPYKPHKLCWALSQILPIISHILSILGFHTNTYRTITKIGSQIILPP